MKNLRRPGVFGIVLALHIAALYLPLNAREEAIARPQTVIVTMLDLPATPAPHPPPPPQHRLPPAAPHARQVIATPAAPAEAAPATTPAATRTEPPQAQVQAPAQPPAQASPPAQPLTLPGELSVSCPERTPPIYPSQSLRLGEQGRVMLRVELDENGRITGASVKTPSGFSRLDQAALNAVKTWRCKPALQNGRAVPAVALQPFSFTLEDR